LNNLAIASTSWPILPQACYVLPTPSMGMARSGNDLPTPPTPLTRILCVTLGLHNTKYLRRKQTSLIELCHALCVVV